MTIIVAGHLAKLIGNDIAEMTEEELASDSVPPRWSEKSAGLFVMADSAISSGNTTILNEFRKIYEINLNIFEPRIVGSVQGFDYVQYSQKLFIAFAGNTLTAQHVLNQIIFHVGNLRVVMKRDGSNKVIMPCQKHGMDGIYFAPHDRHDFSKAHQLIDSDYIRDVVTHGFDLAVRAARRYKRDDAGWRSLFTDMVVGFQCPSSLNFKLFKLSVEVEIIDGVSYPRAECSPVAPGELCVLGANWGDEALSIAESSRSRFVAEDAALFDWMVGKIDAEMEAGRSYVARPAVLKHLSGRTKIETIRTAEMVDEQFEFDRERARDNYLSKLDKESGEGQGHNEIV